MSFRIPALEADRKSAVAALLVSALGLIVIAILVIIALANLDAAQIPLNARTMNSALEAWGLEVEELILILPFGACVVLFTRSILGIDTFGIYTPMLMSLAFIQLGPVLGPVILGGAVLVGILCSPLIERLHLSRIGFMGVVIGIVVTALVLLQMLLGGGLWVTAFPVVVSALFIERFWFAFEADGPGEAVKLAFWSFLIAFIVQFAMVSPPIRELADVHPLLVPVATIPLAILLARYRGLRLTEIFRFGETMEKPDERAWYEPAQRADRAG